MHNQDHNGHSLFHVGASSNWEFNLQKSSVENFVLILNLILSLELLLFSQLQIHQLAFLPSKHQNSKQKKANHKFITLNMHKTPLIDKNPKSILIFIELGVQLTVISWDTAFPGGNTDSVSVTSFISIAFACPDCCSSVAEST